MAEGGRLRAAAVEVVVGGVVPADTLRQGPEVTVSRVQKGCGGGVKGPLGAGRREGGAPQGAAASGWVGWGGLQRADGEGDHLDWIVDIPKEERVGKGHCGKKREGAGRWGVGGHSDLYVSVRVFIYSSCSLSVSVRLLLLLSHSTGHVVECEIFWRKICTGNQTQPAKSRSFASFVARKKIKKFIGLPLSLTLRLFAQVGGQRLAAMLSLDEPLDLKLHRRPNGRDRGGRSPPLSPLHAKRARQLFMADDGTAVIEPASPASPHTGVYPCMSSLLLFLKRCGDE